MMHQDLSAEKTLEDLSSLGLSFYKQGSYDRAKTYMRAALAKAETAPHATQIFQGECYYDLANVERKLGNYKEALRLFEIAGNYANIALLSPASTHLQYVVARNMGFTSLVMQDYPKAQAYFSNAIRIGELIGQEDRVALVRSYYGLSMVLRGGANILQGFEQLKIARNSYPETGREQSLGWATHRYHMGQAYEAEHSYLKALVEFAEARRLGMQMIDPQKTGMLYYNSNIGDISVALGRVCLALGQKKEAKDYLMQAEIYYKAMGASTKLEEVRAKLLELVPFTTLRTSMPMVQVAAPKRLESVEGLASKSGVTDSAAAFFHFAEQAGLSSSAVKAPGMGRVSGGPG